MKTNKFNTLSGYQAKEYIPVDTPYGFRNRKKDVSHMYKPHIYNSKGDNSYRRSNNYHGNVNYVLTKDNFYPYKTDTNLRKQNQEKSNADENKNVKTADVRQEEEGETKEVRTRTPIQAEAAVILLPKQKTELDEVRADWDDSPGKPVDESAMRAEITTPPPSLKPSQQVVAVAAVSSMAPRPVRAAPQTHTDLTRRRLPPEVLANIAGYKLVHAS